MHVIRYEEQTHLFTPEKPGSLSQVADFAIVARLRRLKEISGSALEF